MPSSACDWSSDVCSSDRSEEHTSELQSRSDLVCRLLLEKKKTESGLPFVSANRNDPKRDKASGGLRTALGIFYPYHHVLCTVLNWLPLLTRRPHLSSTLA